MTDKEILLDRKYIRVVRVGTWEYVERTTGKDVVYIVPVTENKWGEPEFVFIKEFRIPFQNYVIGFPAGLVGDIDSKESIVDSARRELLEETGFSAGRMRHLTSGPPSSGLSDETLHFFLADRLTKENDGGGDESEDIEVIQVPVHKAEAFLEEQSKSFIIDIKSYVGMYFVDRLNLE